ncbi:MAG TPA: hypothetical protein VKV34_03955 [Thermoleophilia bacterium]|jgi:hypothetical protein|nr:hypothetical protein [Thermoleophilia bacterium]
MSTVERTAGAEPNGFRVRLTLRMVLPVERPARVDAMRLAWSAALAALPLTVSLAAPVSALGTAGVLGLACAALPGVTATAWSAARMYDSRTGAMRALCQAGAEQRSAWVMATCRVVLFTGVGALVGGVCVIVFHSPLRRLLPKHSPLRPMLAVGGASWSAALVATVILVVLGALLASSPAWRRLDVLLRAAWAALPWSRVERVVSPVWAALRTASLSVRRAVRRLR